MSSPNGWNVTALSLFPDMFPGSLGFSLAGKALHEGLWNLNTLDIRDFSTNKHGNIDDKPFGGGVGMVMCADVLASALDQVKNTCPDTHLVYPSPRGVLFNQSKARELITHQHVTFLCGRFEGVDQRVLSAYNAEEISLGDYILSGGELAALAMMDACIRLLPGVIGKYEAVEEESFGHNNDFSGLLEYPHYTRPSVWNGLEVPEVLLSGNHAVIKEWRLDQSRTLTRLRRKDLWETYQSQHSDGRRTPQEDT